MDPQRIANIQTRAEAERRKSGPDCVHEALSAGATCPTCGRVKPKRSLADRAVAVNATPSGPSVEEKLARAWARHPVKIFLGHRGKLAFFRQLHSMVKAGMGMPVIFAELARYAPDARARAAIEQVARRVADGERLGDAVKSDSGNFDDVTLELVAAAEETGSLEPMLARTLTQMEETQKLRWAAVVSALYPAYLAGGLIFFGPLLSLPTTIRAAGGSTEGVGGSFLAGVIANLLVAGGSAALLFCLPFLITLFGWEEPFDRLKLGVPLVGGVYRNLYAARFAQAFSSAQSAGVEAARTLSIAVRSTGSPLLTAKVERAVQSIRAGDTFADAIHTVGLFDGPAVGLIAIGEKTGELDGTFARLAEEHWEATLRGLKFATWAVMGVVIGGVMLSILMKILSVILGPVSAYYNAVGSGTLQ